MRRLVFLLFAVTFTCLAHAGENETLINRLEIEHVSPDSVVVYNRYGSGRPRLVVVSTYVDQSEGEAILVRLPDSDSGKGEIVDRDDLDSGGGRVSLIRLIDPKDVVVEEQTKHNIPAKVYRVTEEGLDQIASYDANADNTPDLDGDGIPEIVWEAYVRMSTCAVEVEYGVLRWDGREYGSDGHRYLLARRAPAGSNIKDALPIPDSSVPPPTGHYRLRVHRDPGVTNVRVLIDGEAVPSGRLITLKEGCHPYDVKVTGSRGAAAWVFLEERP